MLPTGASRKKYVDETMHLFNIWVISTTYKLITLKAVHVMPALLLQKPSKSLKSKEHLGALTRQLSLREKCPYSELFWPAFSRIRIEYGVIHYMVSSK